MSLLDDILSLGDLSLSQERKPPVSGGVLVSSNSSRVAILRLMLLFNFCLIFTAPATAAFSFVQNSEPATVCVPSPFQRMQVAVILPSLLSSQKKKQNKTKQKRGLGDFEVLQFTKMVAAQRHNGNLDFSNFNFIPLHKEMGTYSHLFVFVSPHKLPVLLIQMILCLMIFNYYVLSLLQTLSFDQQGFD